MQTFIVAPLLVLVFVSSFRRLSLRSGVAGRLRHELRNALRDEPLLFDGEAWEHGQGEGLRPDSFRDRVVALLISEGFVRSLQVDGNGVVNARANSGGVELVHDLVSF